MNMNALTTMQESPFYEAFQFRTWYEILVKIIPTEKGKEISMGSEKIVHLPGEKYVELLRLFEPCSS